MADENLVSYARTAATNAGIDPDLYVAQIQQESKFNPNAYNESSGATGIAQFMPDTAADPGFGVQGGFDPLDPYVSLDRGAQYMRGLTDYFGGDVNKALAAYNFGPGNVEKGLPLPAETQEYLRIITGGSTTNISNNPSTPLEDYNRTYVSSLAETKAAGLELKGKPFEVTAPTTGEIQLAAGVNMMNRLQVQQWLDDKPWMWNYENNSVDGELKNIAASLASGSIRVVGELLKIGSNIRIAANRYDDSPESKQIINSLLPFVEYIDSVEADWARNVNRIDEGNVIADLKEFTVAAGRHLENGNYWAAFSNTLAGAFSAAVQNPVAAATMFAESVPQMYATAASMGLTTVSLASDYSREIYNDFYEANGRRPDTSELNIINAMSLFAAIPDTMSDKLLMKGMPVITGNISKLATAVGIPAKSVARTFGKVAGEVIGQPAQEMVSGGLTELAQQYGAVQDVSRLDPEEIALQAGLEATAVGPLQGARAVKAVVGSAATEVAKRASATVDKSVAAINEASETIQNSIETANIVPGQTVANIDEQNPVAALNTFTTQVIDQQVAQGVSPAEIFVQGQQRVAEAFEYLQTNPESFEQADVDILVQNAEVVNAYGVLQQANLKSVATSELANAIDSIVNAAPTPKQVDDVLHSMKTSFNVTTEQAESILRSKKLNSEQAKQVEAYIRQRKSMEEVMQDVEGGNTATFTGYKVRAKAIIDLLAAGDLEAARNEYRKLRNFAKYQQLKIKALNDVMDYRKGDPIPASLANVKLKGPEQGAYEGWIDEFTVANDLGFDNADPIYNRGMKGLQTIRNRVIAENKVVREVLKTLAEEGQKISKGVKAEVQAEQQAEQAQEKTSEKRNKTPAETVVKEEKYRLFKGKDIWANADQRKAIDQIGSWLADAESAIRNFVLEGRGGTGKTTVLQKIIENAGLKADEVAYTATTHKAKTVLRKTTGNPASTIWSLLGLRPADEKDILRGDSDGSIVRSDGDPDSDPLENIKLIVIDEASMLSEELVEAVTRAEERGIKILYMGDSAQVPPVRTTNKALELAKDTEFGADSNSPVFDEQQFSNRVKLLRVMRQGEESPIRKVTQLFTKVLDNVSNLKKSLVEKRILIKSSDRKTNFDTKTNSGVIFSNNSSNMLKSFIMDYLVNPANTRIVTAFNETNAKQLTSVKNLNARIFKQIYGDTRKYGEHAKGDIVIAYNSVRLNKDDEDESIWNSSEYEIIKASEVSTKQFDTLEIPVQTVTLKDLISGVEITVQVPAVTADTDLKGAKSLKQAIFRVFAEKKRTLSTNDYLDFVQKNEQFRQLANIDLQAAFAITAWKAQGSTYRNTYVMETGFNDRLNYTPTSGKTGYQAMYVALSRPTDKLVIHEMDLNKDAEQVLAENINFNAQETNVGVKPSPVVEETTQKETTPVDVPEDAPAVVEQTIDDTATIEEVLDSEPVQEVVQEEVLLEEPVIPTIDTELAADLFNVDTFNLGQKLVSTLRNVANSGLAFADLFIPKGKQVDDETDTDVDGTQTAYTESSAVSVLRKFPDFMAQYMDGKVMQNLSDSQRAIMDNIVRFDSRFGITLKNILPLVKVPKYNTMFKVDGQLIDEYETNPFLYFVDKVEDQKGEIDPNVVSAMAMAALNWIGAEGRNTTINSNEFINRLTGRPAKGPVDYKKARQLRYVGVPQQQVAEALGKEFLKSLGLRANPEAANDLQSRMEMSAGLAILQTMQELDLIETVEVERSIFGPVPKGQPTKAIFVKAKSDKGNPSKEVAQIIKAYRAKTSTGENLSTVLDTVFGVATASKFPSFKPHRKGKGATYLRSSTPLPEQVRKDINYAQSVPWNFKKSMLHFLENPDRDFLRSIYKSAVGGSYVYDTDSVAVDIRDNVIANNQSIDQEIDGLLEFYEIAKANNFEDFFFDYATWSNSRHGITNTDFNPQNSKLVRHFIQTNKFTVELDPKNEDHINTLKYAIGLGLGIDTDKLVPNRVLKQFEAEIAKPEFIAALDALRVLDTNPTNKEAKKTVLAYVKSAHALDAMQAYKAFVDSNGSKFTIDLANEADAVTSGVIIGLLTAGIDSEAIRRKLNAGGIFFDNSYISFPNWKIEGNKDNYEQLTTLWQEAADNQPLGEAATRVKPYVDAFIGSIKRALAKDPVMVTNYGAGIPATVEAFIDGRIDQLYKDLTDPERKQIALDLLNNLNPNKKLPANFDATKDSVPEDLIELARSAIGSLYGGPLATALEGYSPEFQVFQQTINQGVNAVSWIFQATFEYTKAKVAKTKGISVDKLSKQDLIDIMTSEYMKPFLPMFRLPDSQDKFEGATFIKTEKVWNDAPDAKVQSRFINTKTGTGSYKNTSRTSSVPKRIYADPGVSGMVKFIQSLDDKVIRKLLGSREILSAFDAVYADLSNTSKYARMYSQELLKVTRDFSITESVLETLSQAFNAADFSLIEDSLVDIINPEKNVTFLADEEGLLDIFLSGGSMEQSIGFIVENLKRQLAEERTTKPQMHSEITVVDHAPTINSAVAVDLKIDKMTLDFLNKGLGDDLFMSAKDATPEEDFEADQEFDLTPDSIAQTFDDLEVIGAAKASTSHRNHLSNLLDNVVSPMIARLGPFQLQIRETAQAAQGWLNNKQVFIETNISRLTSNLEMSTQEIYAHELIHAATKAGIADPRNEPTRRELERLQDEAKTHLNKKYNGEGWRVFLKTDAAGNILYQVSEAEEIRVAKDQFDYIFNDTDAVRVSYTDADGNVKYTKQRRALLEFVAIGLTNERMQDALKDMKFTKNKVDTAPTFLGKLEALFLRIVESLSRKLQRTTTLSGDQALLNMVQEMNRAHTKKRYVTESVMNQLSAGNSKVRKQWMRHILEPLGRFNYKMHVKAAAQDGKLAVAMQLATIGAGTILPVHNVPGVDPEAFTNAIESVRRRLHRAKRGLAYEILRQIVPSQDPYMKSLEWMHLQSKNLLDTARERAIDAIRSDIQNEFRTTLSTKEYEALTLGLLQTDVSVLFDKLTATNANQLVRLLKNINNARTDEINMIKRQLKSMYGVTGNYFINQANSLGQLMTTGKARVANTGMNAYVIANGTLVDNFKPVTEVQTAEQLIDRLATLYSIEYLTSDTQNMVSNVIQREFQEGPQKNGVAFMYALHKAFKEESLNKNFDNNRIMMTKGYVKQVFNTHIEVRVGYLSDEEQMLKDNFIRIGEVGFDSADPESQKRYLYVNDAAGLGRYDKAILSMTSEQVKGSSIRNGRLGNQNPDEYLNNSRNVREIKVKNQARVARQFASDNHVDTDPALMVPSVDEKGKIHDYRYIMNQLTRINVLEQKLEAPDILARMYASIKDKTETKRINHNTFDAIHADFVKNFAKFPSDFTKITADSTDPEVRDMYRLMPKETRIYAEEKFGGDIWVRTEALDIIFGKRRFQIARNSYPKIVRIAEEIWKEIVTFAKTNIVIKNPAVITGNILSNTFAGLLRGVPVEEMIRGQLRGIRLLNNYQKDLTRLERLDARLEALKATGEDTTDVRAQIATIKSRLDNSELKPLIDAGLFQTIVEDVNVQADSDGYIKEYFDKYKIKMPMFLQKEEVSGKIKTGIDWAFITRDTGAFKLLMKGTQYSDFVARYAMYNYLTKEAPANRRLSKDRALRVILDMFINYELPTNKYLQYLDDMGLLIFLKYPTRIIRALYSAFKDNPLNALTLVAMETALDPETPLDASFVGAWSPLRAADMTIDSASTVPITNWIP